MMKRMVSVVTFAPTFRNPVAFSPCDGLPKRLESARRILTSGVAGTDSEV